MALARCRTIVFAALAALLLLPSPARAQAWLLLDGDGSVSLIYHHALVKDHVFAEGERFDVGHVRTQLLTMVVEYGLTDRFSIRAWLPFVATKYIGGFGHGFENPPDDFHQLDDGTTHAAFQDVRAEARYGWREFPVAIAPFVGVALPSHNYEFFAHSAVGLNMVELQVGTYAGWLRGPFAIQGRYAFGLYERVAGHRRNRSTIDAEVAWTATERIRLAVFQATQISHGGVELPLASVLDRSIRFNEWWPHHDQIARANHLNIGGGLTVRLSPSMTVHGSVLRTVAGRNTHAAKYGITAGTSWAFGGPRRVHVPPHRP